VREAAGTPSEVDFTPGTVQDGGATRTVTAMGGVIPSTSSTDSSPRRPAADGP